MKPKHFYLLSEQIRSNLIDQINAAELDGKTKVSISPSGTKSAKQRGLQWIWYKDVVESGIGGEDEETTKAVSIKAKGYFGLQIINANPEKYEDFINLYLMVTGSRLMNKKQMDYFMHESFHTEWFDTSETAQFLTSFQVYYTQQGVNLTDPVDKKLLDYKDRFK